MIDLIIIGNNQIEKHIKYKKQYLKKTEFWGLGIENELYLEFTNKKKITKYFFLNNRIRERYSVDYFSSYKKELLEEALKVTLERMGSNVLIIPILINSHTFTKSDINLNHKTLYNKENTPNPEFNGKTIIEFLSEKDDFFTNQDDFWLFDGDTLEIINKNFYNVRLDNVIEEIKLNKEIFINKLNNIFNEANLFQSYGKIDYMTKNHPFASYLTNQNNISMFNNGTIHLNLTLPTELDENAIIKNKELFIKKHMKLIKLIQWMEPLIICVYGSPDPFSTISNYKKKKMFSQCSQRNAISRYISIGIYNTDVMETGKILTKSIDSLPMNKLDYWWYKLLHKSSGYNSLDQIGMDINFNKHWNHGIEIRFLDHIPCTKLLYECFELIIYLGDYILEKKMDFINPIIDECWNKLLYNIMIHGINYKLTMEEIFIYENIFDVKLTKTNVVDVYYQLYYNLKNKFNSIYQNINLNKNINDNDNDNGNYIVEPIGNFSKYALNIQKYKNKPDFYLECLDTEDKLKNKLENKLKNKLESKSINNNLNLDIEITHKSIHNNDLDINQNEILINNVCEKNIKNNECCIIM